ncbi:MAG: glycosyltransferase family 2 protein [Candidatus Omnitrophica bacterium]|nr:glycosyltransferase family 2 protein [Candidatus Omnitrophota bacterium]
MKLSVIMPAYNEEAYIENVVNRVIRQRISGIDSMELIIVDDASSDKTRGLIEKLAKDNSGVIKAVYHSQNTGKGGAILSARQVITGDICIIQDADLEYDPGEYPLVLQPIIDGHADCVYGSRFIGTQAKRVLFFWHYIGNRLLTLISNMTTNLNLTDMETCFKAFRSDIFRTIPIRSKRFGFEPEITSKLARRKCRIFEVGISYRGRTYAEGKKIGWKDGVKAILTIIKYAIIDDSEFRIPGTRT